MVERHVNIKETQTAKSLECEILRGAYFVNEINGKVGGEPLYAKRHFRVPSAKVINVFFLWSMTAPGSAYRVCACTQGSRRSPTHGSLFATAQMGKKTKGT